MADMKKNRDKKIALVAGALDLPFFTRDALRRAGWDVFVVGLKNFYDPRLEPDMVVRLGAAGARCANFGAAALPRLRLSGPSGIRICRTFGRIYGHCLH